MKPRYVILAALAATTLFALAAGSISRLREPWLLAGGSPEHYEIGLDSGVTVSGKGGKFIRDIDGFDRGWGTLMQSISAKNYEGQRLRFQAKVKTSDVRQAGLWMRVDKPEKSGVEFYNSDDKPIAGSTDWQLRSVVLDVPVGSSAIAFGVLQYGKGQVWIDELSFEVVGKDVPVDSLPRKPSTIADRPSL
jgi:hypothetical protein